jgi:hypothetical protein
MIASEILKFNRDMIVERWAIRQIETPLQNMTSGHPMFFGDRW